MKIFKAANNSPTDKDREKISTYLESLEFGKCFGVCLTQIEINQNFLNKMSNIFNYLLHETSPLDAAVLKVNKKWKMSLA